VDGLGPGGVLAVERLVVVVVFYGFEGKGRMREAIHEVVVMVGDVLWWGVGVSPSVGEKNVGQGYLPMCYDASACCCGIREVILMVGDVS
jgi:hypothetical protein